MKTLSEVLKESKFEIDEHLREMDRLAKLIEDLKKKNEIQLHRAQLWEKVAIYAIAISIFFQFLAIILRASGH